MKELLQKLSSRKFMALVAALITTVLVMFKFDGEKINQIVAIVGAFMSIITYIFTQGMVDANQTTEQQKESDG